MNTTTVGDCLSVEAKGFTERDSRALGRALGSGTTGHSTTEKESVLKPGALGPSTADRQRNRDARERGKPLEEEERDLRRGVMQQCRGQTLDRHSWEQIELGLSLGYINLRRLLNLRALDSACVQRA